MRWNGADWAVSPTGCCLPPASAVRSKGGPAGSNAGLCLFGLADVLELNCRYHQHQIRRRTLDVFHLKYSSLSEPSPPLLSPCLDVHLLPHPSSLAVLPTGTPPTESPAKSAHCRRASRPTLASSRSPPTLGCRAPSFGSSVAGPSLRCTGKCSMPPTSRWRRSA